MSLMNADDDDRERFTIKHFDLPEGMTWEMVREAQKIIEKWEDTPGFSDVDLVVRLYKLFSSKI